MTSPLISCIVPVFNGACYLRETLDSILQQTYRPLETIVVDDGSTDGTGEEVARFLRDPRVRYYRQSNAGQTVAKNEGIRHSRGEFIAFCDADDVWLPHKLSVQIPPFARQERLGVVYSRALRMDAAGRRLPTDPSDEPPRPSGRVTAQLFGINFVPFGTAVVRRRCLDELGAFDERYRMGIDWELWLRISLQYEFRFVDADTVVYRVWPGQMSTNWIGRYEYAFRIMDAFVARHPGAVPRDDVRRAWSHSYAQRARMRSATSQEYGAAFADVARALRLAPASRFAWKTLPAVMLAAAGVRRL